MTVLARFQAANPITDNAIIWNECAQCYLPNRDYTGKSWDVDVLADHQNLILKGYKQAMAELGAEVKDAERYRWLRKAGMHDDHIFVMETEFVRGYGSVAFRDRTPEEIDEFIDAAIDAQIAALADRS